MSSPSILIIEDNPLNVELATDLLEAGGFQIRATHTAEEGIRVAHEMMPDLILMDISLPGMDGLAATRALKSDPATSHLKIIGLTAHAMKGDAGSARDAGCDGYLTKPIDTRTFVSTIKSYITAKAA